MKRIRVTHNNPPIPIRNMDYSAIFIDEYEPGLPIGNGRSAKEAIDDLLDQIDGINCNEYIVISDNRHVNK